MTDRETASVPAGLPPSVEAQTVRAVVDEALARYFAERRRRVPDFIERTYSLSGALRTHRKALGHDLWRAPLNAALVGPAVALKGIAWGAERAGRRETAQWLRARQVFMETDVARELSWRLHTELLELPFQDRGRVSRKDALADEILSDPRVAPCLAQLEGAWGLAERERIDARLAEASAIYSNGRVAATEIANLVVTSGIGALTIHQVTPGVLTLGPALASALAERAAAASLPPGLAMVWPLIAPATPGLTASAATTAFVLATSALFSAVAGVVLDPMQKALGLHERRLETLLTALERGFRGDGDARFAVREEYVARLGDLFDLAAMAWRVARH